MKWQKPQRYILVPQNLTIRICLVHIFARAIRTRTATTHKLPKISFPFLEFCKLISDDTLNESLHYLAKKKEHFISCQKITCQVNKVNSQWKCYCEVKPRTAARLFCTRVSLALFYWVDHLAPDCHEKCIAYQLHINTYISQDCEICDHKNDFEWFFSAFLCFSDCFLPLALFLYIKSTAVVA